MSFHSGDGCAICEPGEGRASWLKAKRLPGTGRGFIRQLAYPGGVTNDG
jgi:hypothetical protein